MARFPVHKVSNCQRLSNQMENHPLPSCTTFVCATRHSDEYIKLMFPNWGGETPPEIKTHEFIHVVHIIQIGWAVEPHFFCIKWIYPTNWGSRKIQQYLIHDDISIDMASLGYTHFLDKSHLDMVYKNDIVWTTFTILPQVDWCNIP